MNDVERIPTIGMTHEEWLKERKNGIGGSDAGAGRFGILRTSHPADDRKSNIRKGNPADWV